MPKTPFHNPFSSDSSSDSSSDTVVGRDAAANLARQKIEEAYSSNPPNKEAEQAIAESSPSDELRIEHEEQPAATDTQPE